MARSNSTVQHITARRPTHVDQIPSPPSDTPLFRRPAYRLSWNPWAGRKQRWTYEGILKSITFSALRDTTFFLDTSFIKGHEVPGLVWKALQTRTVVLTPTVLFELREWIKNPTINQDFCESVGCWLLGGESHDLSCVQLSFLAEREMAATLYVTCSLLSRRWIACTPRPWSAREKM